MSPSVAGVFPVTPEQHVTSLVFDERHLTMLKQSMKAHIGSVVLKVVPGCNLACDYCYEYRDDSWQQQPRLMPFGVVDATAQAIGRYAEAHSLPSFNISLHGGEPLLALMQQPDYFDRVIPYMRKTIRGISPNTVPLFTMQTNGVLLNGDRLRSVVRQGILTSVSNDGSLAHDQHRKRRLGSAQRPLGTHRQAHEAILALKRANKELFGGTISVIDPTPLLVDPIDRDAPRKLWEELESYAPPTIDLIPPYGDWDNPPPHMARHFQDTPFAEFLIPIYDLWSREGARKDGTKTDIRLFTSIAALVMGRMSTTEAIGPFTGREIVIRSNGSVERVDTKKIQGQQAVETGLHIEVDPLERIAEVMRSDGELGIKRLTKGCQRCPFSLQHICGGGHPANLHSSQNPEAPSVYCLDYERLITHIRADVRSRLAEGAAAVLAKQRAYEAGATVLPTRQLVRCPGCNPETNRGCCQGGLR